MPSALFSSASFSCSCSISTSSLNLVLARWATAKASSSSARAVSSSSSLEPESSFKLSAVSVASARACVRLCSLAFFSDVKAASCFPSSATCWLCMLSLSCSDVFSRSAASSCSESSFSCASATLSSRLFWSTSLLRRVVSSDPALSWFERDAFSPSSSSSFARSPSSSTLNFSFSSLAFWPPTFSRVSTRCSSSLRSVSLASSSPAIDFNCAESCSPSAACFACHSVAISFCFSLASTVESRLRASSLRSDSKRSWHALSSLSESLFADSRSLRSSPSRCCASSDFCWANSFSCLSRAVLISWSFLNCRSSCSIFDASACALLRFSSSESTCALRSASAFSRISLTCASCCVRMRVISSLFSFSRVFASSLYFSAYSSFSFTLPSDFSASSLTPCSSRCASSTADLAAARSFCIKSCDFAENLAPVSESFCSMNDMSTSTFAGPLGTCSMYEARTFFRSVS
mmetsp:Transcript_9863/g.19697  ORF Transcript_9863/g.19697 Transcript_9863/m.19697 type:complete len:462 (-) Transcript_9863:1461-2846(-)